MSADLAIAQNRKKAEQRAAEIEKFFTRHDEKIWACYQHGREKRGVGLLEVIVKPSRSQLLAGKRAGWRYAPEKEAQRLLDDKRLWNEFQTLLKLGKVAWLAYYKGARLLGTFDDEGERGFDTDALKQGLDKDFPQ